MKTCRELKRKELNLLFFERDNWIHFSLDSSVFKERGSATPNNSMVTNNFRHKRLGPADRQSRKTVLIYESPDYENLISQLTYLN